MNFDEHDSKNLSEMLAIFRSAIMRYWHIAWPPALVIFALVTLLSVRLPDFFVSDVLIFIQPQKISSKIVQSVEKEEQQERFEALVQELLSRPRLAAIIERFDLYPENQGLLGKEIALQRFRSAIVIRPEVSPSGKPLKQTFRLSFRHSDPKMAHQVTKELSNLFIEESIISQRSQTRGTEEFLDAQLSTARKRLEETEKLVQEFVRKNVGKLPEHREQALARLQNAQTQLSTNSQLIATSVARLEYLQKELKLIRNESVVAGMNSGDLAAVSPEASLAQLERALVVLRSRYSEKHPDVINTKKRIALLKSRLAKTEGGTGKKASGRNVVATSPAERTLRREIGELNVQIQAFRDENKTLKRQIEQLNLNVKSMPIKAQELTKINRDYANVKDNYERLLAAKEEASIQSSLVRSQKGSQFKIVDPPSIPIQPAGPQRVMVALIGFFAGIGVFFAIPAGLFFLNGSFKFRDDIEADLGCKVIGVVPPMASPTAKALHRRAGGATFIAAVLSFFAGSLIILITI